MNLQEEIKYFIAYAKKKQLKIYNEISLQLELGIYFRNNSNYEVRFERNIYHYLNSKNPSNQFIKKEIDLVLFPRCEEEFETENKIAIELKFPRNGQYPEQMYNFIKDIKFMEEIKATSHFAETYVLTFVDDSNFYSGSNKSGIYQYFRNNINIVCGPISKPTGNKPSSITLKKNYKTNWIPLINGAANIIENYKNPPYYYCLAI